VWTQEHIIIESERLWLRRLAGKDVDDLLLLFGDPVAMRWFPSVKNREQTEQWLKLNGDAFERHGTSLLACLRKSDGRFLGYCGFIPQADVNGRDELEIGYGLIREFWHCGYATEAAIACKRYGFETLGQKRLISLIRPGNLASIQVAMRNGMRWEADVIRWDLVHGVYSVEAGGLPQGRR
jgi:[ribosomal protein S5]-alanine N-acetyltransferase